MEKVLWFGISYIVVAVGFFVFGILFGRANKGKVTTVVDAGQTVASAAKTVASDIKK